MTDLLSSSQFWLLISIGFYALGVEIQKKTGSPVCNPLLIASILVGALLIATGTPYQTYEESGKLISFFLTPATVALAIPIYRKLDVLLKNLLPILLGAFVGSMVSIGSVLLFSHLFGLSESTTLSLVPKSVTTPIAVAVAGNARRRNLHHRDCGCHHRHHRRDHPADLPQVHRRTQSGADGPVHRHGPPMRSVPRVPLSWVRPKARFPVWRSALPVC